MRGGSRPQAALYVPDEHEAAHSSTEPLAPRAARVRRTAPRPADNVQPPVQAVVSSAAAIPRSTSPRYSLGNSRASAWYHASMSMRRSAGMPRRLKPVRSKPKPPTKRPARLKPTPLRISAILAWADAHHRRTGRWPTRTAGEIPECLWTTWRQVDRALQDGFRGLHGESSLPRLLSRHRGVRNPGDLPNLGVRQILAWADAHHRRTGVWPNEYSGPVVSAPGEKWWNISAALRDGGRGLPGGSSLPRLLEQRRRARNRGHLPRLTVRKVLRWADAYRNRTGRWPTALSGPIAGTNGDTWRGVNNCLIRGARGLPGGMTLADLLAKHRNFRNVRNLPPLTVGQIRRWAEQYFKQHRVWPAHQSGPIPGTTETWSRIHDALRRGCRGLPGGSSLSRSLEG